MRIELTDADIEKCFYFSYKCAETQQDIEFGQHDTAPRAVIEIGRDTYIGKLAEVAFAKMIEKKFNIEVTLDFEYYRRGEYDKQDAVINEWRIDIKGTRSGGKWMLIEWNKLDFRQKENKLPHLFFQASVGWNRNTDMPNGQVDLIGCASILKMHHEAENTVVLRKGDYIPGTKTQLQADNYGIKFEHLEHDWKKVIEYINSNNPPDTSDFKNPYAVEAR